MKIKINCLDKAKWNDANNSHLYRQILATFASSLLCLSTGLTNGITAVLLPKLLEDGEFDWAEGQGSWLAAIAPISSVLGCVCVGMLLDEFGRKTVHIILTFPFVVGWLVMAFSRDFYTMVIGRLITGLSYGAVRPATVIYLGEISDPKYRGIMLLCTSLAVNLGVLLSHVIGTYVTSWNTSLLICIVPNVILLLTLNFVKESPYWLIAKGHVERGVENFRWFRGKFNTAAESELRNVVEKRKGSFSICNMKQLFAVIISRGFIKATVTVVFIFLTVQLCGINAFPFYAYDLLKTMFNDEDSKINDTFLLIMLVDSIRISVGIVICCFGSKMRRKLAFTYAAYGTGLLLLGLAVCRLYNGLFTIHLTLLVLYTSFGSSLVALGWTFVGELYSTEVRGLGSGLSGIICFSFLALCVKITPDLLSHGEPIMYGTFSAITVLCAVVLTFILPETNGRRLQDIEDSYSKKNRNISVTPL